MSKLEIIPLKKPIDAKVFIPGSKSYTNRALILAALTKGPVRLKNPLYSEDTLAMIDCLRTLGLQVEKEENALLVQDDISVIQDKSYALYAHESGTTIRLILSLLCIVPGVKTIQGSKRLNERPIKDLVDALRALGAKIDYCDEEGKFPVNISSANLFHREVSVKGSISSQFLSSLLLISPFLEGVTIKLSGALISKPYIDMTLSIMREFGVKVKIRENAYFIEENQRYQKKEYIIEGDFSSAGYFFAIAALTKSKITVENLNPSSAQADRKFLNILEKMGNQVSLEENAITVQGKQVLASEISMEDCPDQVMTMAVLAAFAEGVTKISGVRSLRVKETERVVAIKNELQKMGIRTEDTRDTLMIYGGAPRAAEISTYNDHRIAMAFAVAGMHLPGMVILNPEVVNKTFPTFWECLRSLG